MFRPRVACPPAKAFLGRFWRSFQCFASLCACSSGKLTRVRNVSWFIQVLPFPSLPHVSLAFLLNFFPFTLSLFSGPGTCFSNVGVLFCFFPHHSERNEVSVSWVCQTQLLAKQILSTFASQSGSPHSKTISQLNQTSNPGLRSNDHNLASIPSSRLTDPVPVLGPDSVSQPVLRDTGNPTIYNNFCFAAHLMIS